MPLMTFEELRKIKFERPYKYVLRGAMGQMLYYFGEMHSYKPDDPQWKIHRQYWGEFLEASKGGKRIAMVEGGSRPSASNEQEAVLKRGGNGLTTFLATKEDIEVISPEPNEVKERTELEQTFSRDEIEYYFFARNVHQWHRMLRSRPDLDFVIYITRYLDDDKKYSSWSVYDFSLAHMKQVHKIIFKSDFNEMDHQFFTDIVDPNQHEAITNEVARQSGIIRNTHIVNTIKKYWDENCSIFVEYGSCHAVMQEPLLREILR